jgi:hypothetical protein
MNLRERLKGAPLPPCLERLGREAPLDALDIMDEAGCFEAPLPYPAEALSRYAALCGIDVMVGYGGDMDVVWQGSDGSVYLAALPASLQEVIALLEDCHEPA